MAGVSKNLQTCFKPPGREERGSEGTYAKEGPHSEIVEVGKFSPQGPRKEAGGKEGLPGGWEDQESEICLRRRWEGWVLMSGISSRETATPGQERQR